MIWVLLADLQHRWTCATSNSAMEWWLSGERLNKAAVPWLKKGAKGASLIWFISNIAYYVLAPVRFLCGTTDPVIKKG